MIKYDPLWRTLKEKGISQYQLIKDYGIDKAQLQRLRQNKNVNIKFDIFSCFYRFAVLHNT